LWRNAAGNRQIYAHVELAKYYEHKARDYTEAAQWTRTALVIVNDSPPDARREWLAALEHRLKRLEAKQRKK
jgi:hypothetical protein